MIFKKYAHPIALLKLLKPEKIRPDQAGATGVQIETVIPMND